MLLLSWTYIILTYFEPRNKNHIPFERWDQEFTICFLIELLVLMVWFIDVILQSMYNFLENVFNLLIEHVTEENLQTGVAKMHDPEQYRNIQQNPLNSRSFFPKSFKIQWCRAIWMLRSQRMLIFRLFMIMLFTTDFVLFSIYYPNCIMERYSRIVKSGKFVF